MEWGGDVRAVSDAQGPSRTLAGALSGDDAVTVACCYAKVRSRLIIWAVVPIGHLRRDLCAVG